MIKILFIVSNIYTYSGVSTVIMNYFRKINKEKYQIDFLIMKKYNKSFENELKDDGSKVFYLKNDISIMNNRNIKREIEQFFKTNKYDIIELHSPTFSFLFLKIAKKCKMPIRIVHSHSTIHSANKIKNLISIILNVNLKRYANKFFACSEKSGNYWYGKKICRSNTYNLITNAINTEKYKFNNELRLELRKKYKIEDKFVIGFVGRISKDKNLPFFIKVMKKVIKNDEKYVFLVVGDGEELKKMKELCQKIKDNVIFLGRRDDVNKQLNCMDLLVLPSKREGLPMVAVEAQLTELPCFLSDSITREVDIGNTKFIKLNKNKWVNEILNFKKQERKIDKEKFNINNCVKKLENIYFQYYNEEEEDNNDI